MVHVIHSSVGGAEWSVIQSLIFAEHDYHHVSTSYWRMIDCTNLFHYMLVISGVLRPLTFRRSEEQLTLYQRLFLGCWLANIVAITSQPNKLRDCAKKFRNMNENVLLRWHHIISGIIRRIYFLDQWDHKVLSIFLTEAKQYTASYVIPSRCL